MWEINELDAFNFNDAANVPPPGNVGNGISIRHAGVPNWENISNPNAQSTISGLPGGAVVGLFGGSSHQVKWVRSYDLVNKIPYPNEIFNGPVYQRSLSRAIALPPKPTVPDRTPASRRNRGGAESTQRNPGAPEDASRGGRDVRVIIAGKDAHLHEDRMG
jgi:hypothetical protein